jgi:hypothetical protein
MYRQPQRKYARGNLPASWGKHPASLAVPTSLTSENNDEFDGEKSRASIIGIGELLTKKHTHI